MNYWDVRTYKDFGEFAGSTMFHESNETGIRTITLKNWRLLEPLLYTVIEMSHAIFRGVEQNTFSLTPSIFRKSAFEQSQTLEKKNRYIESCYNHFLEAIRGRRGPLTKPLNTYNSFEIWSLGRHFGVNSTMLDWSHSPFICIFFAFSSWREEGVRSLYCLKKNLIEAACKGKSQTSMGNHVEPDQSARNLLLSQDPDCDSLLFYKPLSDDNFRMINQQGLFTVSKSPHEIKEWVSQNYELVEQYILQELENEEDEHKRKKLSVDIGSKWILLQIDIETSKDDRKQILKYLNRMNINYATLFPDVEGASLYANMQGEIKHY